MIPRRMLLIGFLVLVFTGSGFAQIYKYYDENGVLCITNDISQVPENQRKTVEQSKEFTGPQTPGMDFQAPAKQPEPAADDEQLQQQMKKEHDRLLQVRKELDEEFSRLKERRSALVAAQEDEMSADDRDAFNQKAGELNDDTLAYKQKKEAYLKAVEAYNQKFEQAGL